MLIIRWLLLGALALAFVLLAVSNWTMVDFILPSGRVTAAPLPLLLGGAFMAGMALTWVWLGLLRPLAEGRAAKKAMAGERVQTASLPQTPLQAPLQTGA